MKVSITAKQAVILFMTMALAVAMVACQAAVKSPASVKKDIADLTFGVGAGAQTVEKLSSFFNVTNATFTAASDNEKVATAKIAGEVLTVTPVGPGTANVTVTAKGDEGEASQSVKVTVAAPTPPPANNPPTVRTIPDESLMVGDTESVTLSKYADDPEGAALTYSAASSNDAVATASVAGAELTITAVAVGTATITVTVSDGTNSVDRDFEVEVTTAPPVEPPGPSNEPPEQTERIPHVGIDDLRREGTYVIDLSDHYFDPDGDDLEFTAVPSDPTIADVNVDGPMLTITGVSVGTANVTVTADDGTDERRQTFRVTVGSQAPEVDPSLPTRFTLDLAGDTMPLNLAKYYDDPEKDDLTYTANSDNTDVATVTDPGDGSMITITAVAEGMATITVTAEDSDNDPVPHAFIVTVGAPPVVNTPPVVLANMVGDMTLQVGATTDRDLSMYFSDEGDTLTYDAVSDDLAAVTVSVAGAELTITAVDVGAAKITITATDSHEESATATFKVTVIAAPLPNRSPESNPIPTVDLTAGGADTVTLSDHFTDPDGDELTYVAVSDATAVATVTGPDANDMITITAVNAGRAWVTVTATDEEGAEKSTRFLVVVIAAPAPAPPDPPPANMPPTLKSGMTLGPFKGIVASYKNIDLDMYFTDDRNDALITYKVEVADEVPRGTGTNVIAIRGAMGWTDADGTTTDPKPCSADAVDDAVPDGTDLDDDMLGICYAMPGTAEITIVAIDAEGMESVPVIVEIMVVSAGDNTAPAPVTTTTILGLTLDSGASDTASDTERLKIGETRLVINNKPISDYFTNGDANEDFPEDVLTLSVKLLPITATATSSADVLSADALAPDKAEVVDPEVSPKIVNGPSDKFTLSIEGKKGTPVGNDAATSGIKVALIATDSYGQRAASTPFIVRVNHDPKAYGAQTAEKDRKTLSTEDDYMNLLWDGVDREEGAFPTTGLTDIFLVQAGSETDGEESNGGYFSDEDGVANLIGTATDDVGCSVVGKTGDSLRFNITEVADTTITLSVIPKKLGPMSLTIECVDTFGKKAQDTLDLYVRRQGAGSLQ